MLSKQVTSEGDVKCVCRLPVTKMPRLLHGEHLFHMCNGDGACCEAPLLLGTSEHTSPLGALVCLSLTHKLKRLWHLQPLLRHS